MQQVVCIFQLSTNFRLCRLTKEFRILFPSPPAPTGRYRTPSLWRTRTKQVAKKWCRCVISNLCIIKILFEQMSQEVSGPLSQAGAAKFFWPSAAELGVLVRLAPAGIAATVREPCLPVGAEGRVVLPSPAGTQPCGGWFSVHGLL